MPPLPSSVSLPAWPKSWSLPEPPVIVSLPAPPNRFARGSAPFASFSVIDVVAAVAEDLDQGRVGDRRRAAGPRRRRRSRGSLPAASRLTRRCCVVAEHGRRETSADACGRDSAPARLRRCDVDAEPVENSNRCDGFTRRCCLRKYVMPLAPRIRGLIDQGSRIARLAKAVKRLREVLEQGAFRRRHEQLRRHAGAAAALQGDSRSARRIHLDGGDEPGLAGLRVGDAVRRDERDGRRAAAAWCADRKRSGAPAPATSSRRCRCPAGGCALRRRASRARAPRRGCGSRGAITSPTAETRSAITSPSTGERTSCRSDLVQRRAQALFQLADARGGLAQLRPSRPAGTGCAPARCAPAARRCAGARWRARCGLRRCRLR